MNILYQKKKKNTLLSIMDLHKIYIFSILRAHWADTELRMNAENEIIGYEFVSLGKMMDFIKKGIDANEALTKATGHYGQWDTAAKYIDPRQE